MSELPERIDRLSADRRALLDALAEVRGDGGDIPRRPQGGHIPASFAQQRLWFMDQLEPGNTAYNCPITIRLHGALDREALAASLSDIVDRHEALRTTFHNADGQPLQVVHLSRPVPLPLTDLTGRDRDEQEAIVRRTVLADAGRAFDLAQGPLLRAELLRLSPAEHVLLYDIHHIAFDAWSLGVFYSELASLYSARVCGTEAALDDLPVQYADYALWQRDRMRDTFLDELLAFWRQQLHGLVPLDLPTDRPRPPVLSSAGGLRQIELPANLVARLRALGKAQGASTFMTLVAALNLLLSRYTGQDDVAVGTAATGRDRRAVQALIGFFANTVVLRTDLSGDPTFIELLGRVREMARSAYAHAELPFDLLVQELHPQRDPSRIPLFPVYFTLEENPEVLPGLEGLEVETFAADFMTAKFDLGFGVRLSDAGSVLYSVFSADLFDEATVDRMLGHFLTLLEGVAAEPDRPVAELSILSEPERQRVFVEWNDTAQPFPDEACLHQLFEANVEHLGDALAVACGERAVTYAELEAQANRLAHRLRALGVGPEATVGICLDRSVELVVAILGVLKAGGAYLPLDPDYPGDRMAFMLRDAGAPVVITDRALGRRVDTGDAQPLHLDAEDLSGESSQRPVSGVTAENLAYVIYTSGSTGSPKGIALRHRGAVNNFCDFNGRFDIGPGDRVLAVSSPSFDMSVYDVLGMLAAGGTVVLLPAAEAKDPARWTRLILDHEVTVWHSAPALLELLVEHLERNGGRLPSLRLALLGGDWIAVTLPDRFRTVASEARFISLGGATEASMDSIIFGVEQVDPAWSSIPYGRPMANQRAYVLDRNLQALPVGVPGELHLAGTGLARGYLHRHELTAQRFVEHTFEGVLTERLYKTGDLARYGPDGVIELLGRMDLQVKIHGLRIELGEIESVLRRHEALEHAAVVARGERGQTWTAGFYVLRAGRDVAEADLRRWLGERLPAFMVPAALVAVDRLPTSPNGKVDRRALTTWEISRVSGRDDPRDPLEERVAEAWREVLGVEGFGMDDNFFDLGGDSFLAIRAVMAIDAALPVVELFKNPTVRELAAKLRSAEPVSAALLHELTPPGRDPELSVVGVPYGGGNAVAYQALADQLPPQLSLWSVGLPGHDPSARDDALIPLEEAARRCADEILERVPGPVVVYGQCAGVALAVELARVLEDRGADLRAVYLGAGLPDPDPETSLARERVTADHEVYDYLRSIGGFDGPLEWAEVAHILRVVRHDMVESSKLFQRAYAAPPRKLRAPVHCLIGESDPATPDWAVRFREWELFAEDVDVAVVEGGDHYFVRNRAAEVAALLGARVGSRV